MYSSNRNSFGRNDYQYGINGYQPIAANQNYANNMMPSQWNPNLARGQQMKGPVYYYKNGQMGPRR